MGSEGIAPPPATGHPGQRSTLVDLGRAVAIAFLGTAIGLGAWAALFGSTDLMGSQTGGWLMIFVAPPLLAAVIGMATARFGERTIRAAIAGALGGWLACALIPHLLTLVGGRVDPNAYAGWLIAASSIGVVSFAIGFAVASLFARD